MKPLLSTAVLKGVLKIKTADLIVHLAVLVFGGRGADNGKAGEKKAP